MSRSKRTIALLLLGLYFIAAPGTGELIKIPVLAEHYFEFAREEKKEGLVSFLIEHYLKEDGTDKDAKEDNRLPFKSITLTNTINIIIPVAFFEICQPKTTEQIFLIHYGSLFLSSCFLDSIWQPPRYSDINIS